MNLKPDSHMVQQSVPATTPAVNTIQKQQNAMSQGSTHKSFYLLAGMVVAGILLESRECKKQGHKEGFYTPLVHKITHKWPHHKHRQQRKTHMNSLVPNFLSNNKSNQKYVSVKLNSHSVWLPIDIVLDITLTAQRLWKTIGQIPLTTTRRVA